MNIQSDWKPALTGAAVGTVALAIIGFGGGGWATASSSQKSAQQSATLAVIVALAAICVGQFQRAANASMKQAELRKITS